MSNSTKPTPITSFHNILLPSSPSPRDISISESGHISSITRSTPSSISNLASASLLALPSLCHPHIHLDKAHLLTHPSTCHLQPTSGTFAEALEITSSAKKLFTPSSLRERMDWLIADSIRYGVTCMRAFCEVDATVGHMCLEAGLAAKQRWSAHIDIQICAFAQDPVFSGAHGDENRRLMEECLGWDGVDVLGATPYVEESGEKERENVRWAVKTAMTKEVALDLHLDYNITEDTDPRVWDVLRELREQGWVNGGETTASGIRKTVCLGHCTRLTLFKEDEWKRLREEVEGLPVYFVGLPTSDLFMMGRPAEGEEVADRRRATLQIPAMIERGFDGAIGVNNVGNAFTPYGSGDPLELVRWGVGVYQIGTGERAEALFGCISGRAKEAIGLANKSASDVTDLQVGDKTDLLLIGKPDNSEGPFYRRRRTIKEVVWDAGSDRLTIFGGRQLSI